MVLSSFLERVVSEFLKRSIKEGSLKIVLEDQGRELNYGASEQDSISVGNPVASIIVKNSYSFFYRTAFYADIGFAEAFIENDFDVKSANDLLKVFKIFIVNRDNQSINLSRLSRFSISRIGAILNRIKHLWHSNTLSGSAKNIHSVYDLSNEFHSTFLGSTMGYTSGYYSSKKTTMDEAQIEKFNQILQLARVESNMHILDIGCGWGYLGIEAAKKYGCKVTAINLSDEQLQFARERAKEQMVSHLVRFIKMDYREVSKLNTSFDRITSVEMIEHVGSAYYNDYFKAMESVLKPDGLLVMQAITLPECRYEEYLRESDFIQKHIFTGCEIPSFESLVVAASKGGNFSVEMANNIGVHYATTLREWRSNFMKAVDSGTITKLGFDKEFIRKYLYYFIYCEAGFVTRTLGDMQIVFTRTGNTTSLEPCPKLYADD